ncbi:MAG TPA: serine/threonine-protein kinase [Pyrinomonadaceae bacterium]|jgi:serine/threonine protein kinase
MKVCSVCGQCYEDSTFSCIEENHPALSETRDGSREMIAGYRLDFLLESGVECELYRACHTASGKFCLVKIFAAREENSPQILREAKLAAELSHPNVNYVYEIGTLKSSENFVVTAEEEEEADGKTLRDFLNEVGTPPLVTAIQIARQTAEALHAVHLKGLTHRAVNPANIILTTDAEQRPLVKIQNFDFGGVSQRVIISDKFSGEAALNSLRYFAPEQCTGEAVSAQTDVYSLGVVFYEMLAGAPPFDATNAAALIEKQKNQPPPEIKINNFDLRMLLTHTLMEALRKQPKLRHASANVFARQLRHIEQLATHSSTPPPAVTAKPKPQKVAAVPTVNQFSVQPASTSETSENFFKENSDSVALINREGSSQGLTQIQETAGFSFEETLVENENALIENFDEKEDAPVREMAQLSGETPENLHLSNESTTGEIVRAELTENNIVQTETADDNIFQAYPAEKLPIAPAAHKPTLIEWQQPEEDIPSETEALEIQLREQLAEFSNVPGATRFAAEDFPLEEEDYLADEDFSPDENFVTDEDFLTAANKFEISPAFTRDADGRKPFDSRGSIFSSYSASSAAFFPVDRRALFIGGFAGLLVLFLSGYALITGRLNWGFFSEPITAKTAPEQKPLPQQFEPINTVSPPQQQQQQNVKNSENVLPAEDDADLNQLQPLPIDRRPLLSREKPSTSIAKTSVRNQSPPTPTVSRNAEKPATPSSTQGKPIVPSTIVIFSDNGKIKSRVETEKKNAAKKSTSTSNQSDIFTRPRIVKNPEP